VKAAVVVFPGSNCDRDLAVALHAVTGTEPVMVWHRDTELPDGIDLIALPGGFSHGDYLRSGAMAARAPMMRAVADAAARGTAVLGVCNGFQVLTEVGLLPGALMRITTVITSPMPKCSTGSRARVAWCSATPARSTARRAISRVSSTTPGMCSA